MDILTKQTLYDFIRARSQAVIATSGEEGIPEAALVDIAATPELEIIFETTSATRKFVNLAGNPKVALVIGWGGNETLQYDGICDRPEGRLLEQIKGHYLSVFPEKASHQHWPDNYYFRVKPAWMRFSDYYPPRKIREYHFPIGEAAEHGRWHGLFTRKRRQRN